MEELKQQLDFVQLNLDSNRIQRAAIGLLRIKERFSDDQLIRFPQVETLAYQIVEKDRVTLSKLGTQK